MRELSQEDAALIVEAHDIDKLLDNEEEVDLLEEHNPALLTAYENLIALASGSD
jgi:hypothetical protein